MPLGILAISCDSHNAALWNTSLDHGGAYTSRMYPSAHTNLGRSNVRCSSLSSRQVCKVGLAGHVGFADDTGASLAGNFDALTRQAFKNLEKTLQRAGGTLKDIAWMAVAIPDGRFSQRFTDIRKELYGKTSHPAHCWQEAD